MFSFLGSWTPFNPETVRLMIGNTVFQSISIPPHHRRDWKFHRSWGGGGGGGVKAPQNIRDSVKIYWNFQRGGRRPGGGIFRKKIPSIGGERGYVYGYFLEVHADVVKYSCIFS